MSDMPGSNVIPFHGGGMPMGAGGMPMGPPPMQINPEFLQWMKLKEMRDAETQKRQQKFEAACALIKEDVCKSYKIDIEADSTIAADQDAEKASRTEFLLAIVPFMQVVVPQMASLPAIAPLAVEMIKFAFHAFPVSRQLEAALDEALVKMAQMPPGAGGQGEEGKKSIAETKMEVELGHKQIQADVAQTQMKIQADQQAAGMKMMAEQAKAQAAMQKASQDAGLKQVELALRAREVQGHEQLEMARIRRLNSRNAEGLE